MLVKTNFAEFEVKIDGAVFKVKEGDPSKYMLGRITTDGKGKASINMVDIYEYFISECLTGWDGVFDEKNVPLAFKSENFVYIPVSVRTQIWQEFINKCSISESEKKS